MFFVMAKKIKQKGSVKEEMKRRKDVDQIERRTRNRKKREESGGEERK